MTTLTYPTYDAKGGISMSQVMYAPYQLFEDNGLDVVGFLEGIICHLNARLFDGSHKNAASDVAYAALDKYNTPEGKKRQPGYQCPAMFCLAYRTFVLLTDTSGLDSADTDEFILRRAVAMMKCELDKLINGTLVGPCAEPLPIKRGDTVLIPKGTAYTTTYRKTGMTGFNGEKVTKRAYKVKVHNVFNGYYGRTIHNPKISWAGTGGYWCDAEMKDVEKVG